MAGQERVAGTPNSVYDAVAILYRTLQAGAQYNEYIADADREGDQEMADLFRRIQQEDSRRADDLKKLLNTRLVTSS